MVISTVNMGTADYSIQLVQPDVPLQKGGTYKVTFDAYADEARTMIADISDRIIIIRGIEGYKSGTWNTENDIYLCVSDDRFR